VHIDVRNSLVFVVLAGAASASWYFGRGDLTGDTAIVGEGQGPLGYYLRDADISIMDEDGSMLYRILAAAVEEQPAENRTLLADVRIEYSPAADIPWQVRAEQGEIPADEQYLDLSGSVELATTEGSSGETTTIRAARIRFAPEEYLATTDAGVTVALGDERLEAVGMKADLKGDRLELESSVHGQFSP